MDPRLCIIFARRSTRKYTNQLVSDADVKSLLEAGMAAPSASNRKPWHFVVVTDRQMLDELALKHPFGKMLHHAPLAIAICGDPGVSKWWVQDCSAAAENILLAAVSLGLGGAWLGSHGAPERERALQEVLRIPDHIRILSLLSIGYPAETLAARTQYDSSRVHENGW